MNETLATDMKFHNWNDDDWYVIDPHTLHIEMNYSPGASVADMQAHHPGALILEGRDCKHVKNWSAYEHR